MIQEDFTIITLQKLCVKRLPNLEQAIRREPAMLFIIFCKHFKSMLTTERQAIALTILANDLTSENEDIIMLYADVENMNIVMKKSEMYSGETLAFNLMKSESGRKLLLRGNLAEMINASTLNAVVKGNHGGESVALLLLTSTDSDALLLVERCRFAEKIDRVSLNQVVEIGPYQHLSPAILLAATPLGRLVLCSSAARIIPLFDSGTINDTMVDGAWRGLSVAFLLLSSPYADRYFGAHLKDMITNDCLARIIKVPEYAGQSVALHFLHMTEHLSMKMALQIPTDTLNHIVTGGSNDFVGTSVALHLLLTKSQCRKYFNDPRNLCKLTEKCINAVVPAGKYKGLSVPWLLAERMIHDISFTTPRVKDVLKGLTFGMVHYDTVNAQCTLGKLHTTLGAVLATTEFGCEILADDSCSLARLFSLLSLNPRNSLEFLSSVYFLASVGQPASVKYFEVHSGNFLSIINPKSSGPLDEPVDVSPLLELSLVAWLVRCLTKNEDVIDLLLTKYNYCLSKIISTDTLNHIILNTNKDDLNHLSLAFCLGLSPRGHDILKRNDFHLADSISPEVLNYIVPSDSPHYPDLSLALILATTHSGREILARKKCRLAMSITEKTLNHVVERRYIVKYIGCPHGQSVAFCLAAVIPNTIKEGEVNVHFMAANDYYLGKMISERSLNQLCLASDRRFTSVAFWLSNSHGDVLIHNNCRLVDLINAETLNTVVPSGPCANLSVARVIAATKPWLYERSDCRLALMLTADSLNSVEPTRYKNLRSVAFYIAYRGLDALVAYDYYLAAMLTSDTLNSKSIFKMLCSHAKGRAVLCSQDMRLARLVTDDILYSKSPDLEYINDQENSDLMDLSPWDILIWGSGPHDVCPFQRQLVVFYEERRREREKAAAAQVHVVEDAENDDSDEEYVACLIS